MVFQETREVAGLVKFETRRFKGAEPYLPPIPRCQAEVLDEASGAARQCKRDARFASPPEFKGECLWCRQHSEFDRFKNAIRWDGN